MSILSTSSGSADAVSSILVTRPAGAGAAHVLALILSRDTVAGGHIAAPTGWTRRHERQGVAFNCQLAVFTAPGDVAALTFNVPTGTANLRYGCLALAGRGSEHEDSDSAESTTTTTEVPATTATQGADGLFAWFNPQAVTDFGAAPGGVTDFFSEGATVGRFIAAHAANLTAGTVGPFARSAPNFNCKLAMGILVPQSGGAVIIPMGTRIFVNG